MYKITLDILIGYSVVHNRIMLYKPLLFFMVIYVEMELWSEDSLYRNMEFKILHPHTIILHPMQPMAAHIAM